MTLLPKSQPIDDVWVALDLETTGLSAERDAIIEIGAVKFQGRNELDTFQTFVNPGQRLTDFITQYTGITQADVDGAPNFASVSAKFASFVGSNPILGHNVGCDLGFLSQNGLRFTNPISDTWDLAYVLYPALHEYSLGALARMVRASHDNPHRALDDAIATRDVFLAMLDKLAELDVYTLAEMQRLASRSQWVLSHVLSSQASRAVASAVRSPADSIGAASPSRVGVIGIDPQELAGRLKQGRALRPSGASDPLDIEMITGMLEENSPLAEAIPGFERRSEQIEMARAVAEAINNGERLIVEAGTGVGKSLAYLLPAVMYAVSNGRRVVVSTNTINLQEQLMNKDVPMLVKALEATADFPIEDFKYTQLKGRANYLCFKRWNYMRSGESLSEDEARMVAKTLTWLQSTKTGDRAELNLGHRSAAAPWDRLSAQGAYECLSSGGPCFLRAARERAASSHLIIVNHALLLSDVAAGGTLIPEYDVLIIDEAHHLEDEATKHLGFDLAQSALDEHIQSLSGERGLFNQATSAFRGSSASQGRRETVEKIAAQATEIIPRMRDYLTQLFGSMAGISGDTEKRPSNGFQVAEVRITSGTRAQPDWSDLEIQWENADVALDVLGHSLRDLQVALEGLEEAGLVGYEGLNIEVLAALQRHIELRQKLDEFVVNSKPDGIYWTTRVPNSGDLVLHAAPLHVGQTLEDELYSKKECVILTSATLSTGETFDHIRERTGFSNATEVLMGSPFNYPESALLCVPNDRPEPSSWAYAEAMEQAITDAALAAGGRTMALFTSYASLRSTAASIKPGLQAKGLNVLAQGIDGSPAQLVSRFLAQPESVLLGTSSFWEGVDLAGESLQVLLVARLPFGVPTQPVYAARSEMYDNPFMQYAVPQAILRLRQGFGRLIRTKSDRGVAIILDSRIISKRYGKTFIKSLPDMNMVTPSLHQIGDEIGKWLGR